MKPINFEVIKEKWNEYNLTDGSTIRTRTILNSVFTEHDGKNKKYTFDCQQTSTIISPKLMGTPDATPHTQETLKQNIEVDNCNYITISYEVNEYLLDDGSTLLINTNITNIARTTLCDKNGSRVYVIEAAGQVVIKPFKSNQG